MIAKSKTNPSEVLCLMAAETANYHEEIEHLIKTYGVFGTTPPANKTGVIAVYDLEQALLRIPAHKYDPHIKILKLLLSYNLSNNLVTRALNHAVAKSQFNSVRLLLDHGAAPNHLDEAAAAGDLDAIYSLIEAGADISRATKAVSLAAGNGRTKTLHLLLELGFPYDLRTIGYDALLSNNPSTIDAVRKLGVEYTAMDMDDEDLVLVPKSVDYLVSLGLPRPTFDED